MKTKSRLRRILLFALGTAVLLLVVAAIALPRLIDAESYRGLLKSKLEQQLGRDVEFGAMELSMWPVVGLRLDELAIGRTDAERFDRPVVADSLRVGARLFPLLRGRLEVQSLVVERPVLSLYRRPDGGWEPQLAVAENAQDPPAESAPLVIDRLRITDGRVVLRRDEAGALLETTLDDLRLRLDGLGTGGPVSFAIETGVGESGTLDGNGTLHPADAAVGRPLRFSGGLEIAKMSPPTLREWLAAVAPTVTLPADLLVDRPFDARANFEYTDGPPPQLTISGASLRKAGLRLVRSVSGAWNLPSPAEPAAAEPSADGVEAMTIRLAGLTIEDASIRIEDRTTTGNGSGASPVLQLESLRLSLDRLPMEQSAALELDTRIGGDKSGKLTVRGTLGPVGEDPAATPFDLSLRLESLMLAELGTLLPAMENLDLSRATASADLKLSGAFANRLEAAGNLSLAKATVALASPQGDLRRLPFDLRARGEVVLSEAAGRIELPKLELELPRGEANRALTLRGSIDAAVEPPRIDLELLPTTVSADDLAALAALLAPDAPLRFASPDPVALQVRVRGALGGEVLPELDGRATLSGFTFRFAGMTQPMERVGAIVTFSQDRITLDALEGVIGKSDVTASRVVISDFAAPRLQLDLSSRNADFWELFSFIEEEETAAATPVAADDPLALLTIEGKLRIDQGSLQTLAFEKLTAGIEFRRGVLELAPLEMDLYGGRFAGKLVQDLNTEVLTIDGKGNGIDTDAFLAQNLALGGVVAGLASTELDVKVRSADPADVLSGVSGGGPLQLVDGRLAKLDVLKSLTKVTGILGERSLQKLTKQLATAGTPFRRAETRLSFDSGTLAFEDLVIETAELTLAGRAALESATGKLDGRFAVAFSPELSAAMRAEKSRAADLFWDPKAQRVSFGFDVGGLATAPGVSVNWESALRGVAERKLEDRLRGILGSKLGGGAPAPAAAATPAGPSTQAADATTPDGTGGAAGGPDDGGATRTDPGSAASPDDVPSSAPPGLKAELTRTRWTGPLLLRDLALEGNVHGAGIERASLTVVDARGVEVRKIDRLRPVNEQLASLGDRDAQATLSWRAEIDGKRLLAASFPVTVTVTVHDREGHSASATREVDR